MTSLLAKRALSSLRTRNFGHVRQCTRNTRFIHSTPAVLKKKSKAIIDDLFPETDESGDLFKDESSQAAASTSASAAVKTATVQNAGTSSTQPDTASVKKRLSHEERRERYDKLLDFVKPRLGRKPAVRLPQVRNSAWINLVGLAATKEQLQEVAELFPGWRASGREFDTQFSELFVRRCQELSCPLLALDVFGDYAKYSLKLTLPGARQLLHSLHVDHPIDKVIAASALYSVYSLTPIAQDLVSCSMLVSACFKHNSKDSLKVANALVPHLRRMVQQTGPVSVGAPTEKKATEKSQAWLQWTLRKVDKALFAQNDTRAEWLRDWRTRNGHILEPSQF
ncbi:hypothetical protein AX17_003861 [Amanita inopinata Kibby_2008]|nr:hypothetical protein AX17_003861 [Amanita inopinata Kibby_2008]